MTKKKTARKKPEPINAIEFQELKRASKLLHQRVRKSFTGSNTALEWFWDKAWDKTRELEDLCLEFEKDMREALKKATGGSSE